MVKVEERVGNLSNKDDNKETRNLTESCARLFRSLS